MRTKLSMKKKTAATLTAGFLVAGTAAGAYAYWTTSGNGTGSATAGTTANFTVATVTDASAGALTPGGPTQSVAITVTNPGTGYQKVSQVIASVTDTSNAGCTANDFKVGSAPAGAAQTVLFGENLAPGTSATHSVNLQMVDTGLNQEACKTATVHLAFAAS